MGRILFLLLIIVLLQMFHSSLCVHANQLESLGFIRCKKHELDALLKFKQSFTNDPKKLLSSWVGDDCCLWHGVTCDNVTDNVVKLNLRSQPQHLFENYLEYDGCLPDPDVSMVSSRVNSALLELKLLTHLDLSGNNFSGSLIPEFIGSLRRLRYLNLSSAGFSGSLPPQLGNLTNMVHLDLQFASQQCLILYDLYTEDFIWASGLLKLQSLHMSGYNLSRAHDTFKVLNTLPSLSALSLPNCVLDNSHLSEALVANTSNSFFPTLQHLDLPSNSFEGPLPSGFRNMVSLRSLSLSANNFNGSVPLWLRAMRKLEVLDLSANDFIYVEGGILGIMGNPCKFKYLDLSSNNIPQGDIIEHSLSFSGCDAFELQYLNLHGNKINGSLSSLLTLLTNLNYLDLSDNSMKGSLPSSFGQLLNLNYLDLSGNSMNGSLPSSFGQLLNLNYLDLSGNSMNGSLPYSFGQLSNLNYLDLRDNSMNGSLPSSFGQLSNLKNLNYLDLRGNSMNGSLPSSFGQLSNLNYLFLSHNEFNGQVPASFVNLSALKHLDLSDNQLSGSIQDFIGHLTHLEHLDISSNSFQGSVFGVGNLSKLLSLDMNYNNLNLDSSFNWRPLFQLQIFSAHSCGINTVFPQWLRNQTQLEELDLSNTGISGELPRWLWNLSSLIQLKLYGNQLTGSLPQHIACDNRNLLWLDLHNNLLTGTIPKCLGHLQNAQVIDLSANMLTGVIFNGNNASSLFNIGNSLIVLDLSDNMLSGEIQFGKVPPDNRLQILSLRGNYFIGPIPPQLCDCKSLFVMVLAENRLNGHIPRCLGSMPFSGVREFFNYESLQIEEIVKGIAELFAGLKWNQSIIDLSSNYLAGTIPEELTNISPLFALNLSYNHLIGHIPYKIGNLKTIESLDLSNNHLSGIIPQSLSSIPWLSKLNLSNNHLHGPIPKGSQLQTLDNPSIYTGNSGLCGFPLPNCNKPDPPPSLTNANPTAGKDDVKKKEKYDKMWFILAVMSGVATGFWGVVGTLVIKRSWREAYFRSVEDLADRIYVPIKVTVNRFKRRIDENS